jgi:hypothetical protein
MSEHSAFDIEVMLRRALAPVDPPADLELRMESTLDSLVELAADELESWELSAMKNPRNWLRPVAAVVVGSGAAAGLVVLRTQRRRPRRRAASHGALDLTQRTLRDAAREAMRVFDQISPRR